MNSRTWLSFALVVQTSSCTSVDIAIPPIERLGRESNVRAWDEATATRLANACERLAPAIRELKRIEKPAPLLIASREDLPGPAIGVQIETGIILDPETSRWELWCLAHELSHWFSDDVWRLLPGVVEEGLADHVATLVVPVEASRRLNARIFEVPELVDRSSFRQACSKDLTFEGELSLGDQERLRAIGHVAAAAIGIQGLREMCVRTEAAKLATVPADWIYDALPFAAGAQSAWRAAHNRRMNEIDAEAARIKQEEAAASTPAVVPESR
jgi:hypothetical protein